MPPKGSKRTPSPATPAVATPTRASVKSTPASPAASPASPAPAAPAQSPATASSQRQRPSQTQQRTPERPRSQSSGDKAAAKTTAAPSQSMPPPRAPANSPVPASSKTQPRAQSTPAQPPSSHRKRSAETAQASPANAAASPARPPPPPPSPAPVDKKAKASTSPPPPPQPQQQQQPPAESPAKRGTAADADNAAPKNSAAQRKNSRSARRQRASAAIKAAAVSAAAGPRAAVNSNPVTAAAAASPEARFVETFIRASQVIAPDVSGVCRVAVHPSEHEVVLARENGSLVRYDVSFFQGVPQFVQRRHTGGQTQRTITGLAYVAVPAPASSVVAATAPRYVLLASMMSGQIVVYDPELLVPVALHQRSGGAIWALHAVSAACIYAAMADGSWQQLHLTCRREGAAPQVELVRVVPGITGADRALAVAASTSLRIAVGTDDAGNVHAWRLPASAAAAASQDGSAASATAAAEDEAAGSGRARGLAEHESLWTTKLAKGIALSCVVVGSSRRPCVVVGTSMGDVVLLDAAHGHAFQTFSQHKGPVTALTVEADRVVYVSGWHESLRSYRCNEQGDWYPAEVKRRTHYHEASQLALLPQRQLLLSAARDGTVLYAPTSQLFHSPAMYLAVTTQQFAYAAGREVLLQSRYDTIEAFQMDGAGRHWLPRFGHRLDGRFHLAGLWCDERLHYIVFSTEERVGVLRVVWRSGAAMAVSRIEEVLELPARTGLVDVSWSSSPPSRTTAPASSLDGVEEAAEESPKTSARRLYLLYDDNVTCVTLTDGYPVVHAPLQVRGKQLPGDSVRPYRVLCRGGSVSDATGASKKGSTPAAKRPERAVEEEELVIYGHRGSCRLRLMADGTPCADSLVADLDDVFALVQAVPRLATQATAAAPDGADAGPAAKRAKTEAAAPAPPKARAPVKEAEEAPALVGLSVTQQRYLVARALHSGAAPAAGSTQLPATLPHDVRWIASIPAAAGGCKYVGYFSRGLLVATAEKWHMVRRMNVEAAFLIKDGSEVLVLERNLEKTLESLPLCWKVRRFGN